MILGDTLAAAVTLTLFIFIAHITMKQYRCFDTYTENIISENSTNLKLICTILYSH